MSAVNYGALHILVIDDEPFVRNLIHRMLREIGVTYITLKGNGKDGLMETVRSRPDIIFCDVHMEPMNGRMFLQGLRGITTNRIGDTPVVFLTADAEKATVIFAREHKVSGYLVKPVSVKQLRERIESIVLGDTERFARAIT